MELADYLRADRGRAVKLAKLCARTSSFISQLATKRRPVPAEHCAQIEAVTAFEVRRWDLRPHDWHRIWPELIGTEGAPNPNPTEVRDAA